MSKLIELTVGNESVYVEAEGPAGPGQYSTSTTEKVSNSMDESLKVLGAVGRAIKTSLADVGASEAEATIAVKFSAKGNVIIAEASGEASMTVKLKFAG